MAKAKEPLRRASPQVRQLVDQLLLSGWTTPRVRRELERLAEDDDLRRQWCPGASREDLLGVSERSIYERRDWLRKQVSVESSREEWYWWEESDLTVARLVLDALAAFGRVTGQEWSAPLTQSLVKWLVRLVGLAPDLPLHLSLVLAKWASDGEHYPEPYRREMFDALGLYLAYRPWTSREAHERYSCILDRTILTILPDPRTLPFGVVLLGPVTCEPVAEVATVPTPSDAQQAVAREGDSTGT